MRRVELRNVKRKAGFASSRARRRRGSLREEMSAKSQQRFAKMTAEERSEYGRQLRAKRTAKDRARKAAEEAKRTGEPPLDDDLVL